jgi:hypothetical protein
MAVAILAPAAAVAQMGPPPPCRATLGDALIALASLNWVPPAGGNPWGFWQYVWDWTLYYDCSAGFFNNCKACLQFKVSYWNAARQDWEIAPAGELDPGPSQGNCNDEMRATGTVTWGWPLGGGTRIRAELWAAAFDPVRGATCDAQAFSLQLSRTYTIPPDGS